MECAQGRHVPHKPKVEVTNVRAYVPEHGSGRQRACQPLEQRRQITLFAEEDVEQAERGIITEVEPGRPDIWDIQREIVQSAHYGYALANQPAGARQVQPAVDEQVKLDEETGDHEEGLR
jgi:hypothetical protein